MSSNIEIKIPHKPPTDHQTLYLFALKNKFLLLRYRSYTARKFAALDSDGFTDNLRFRCRVDM